MRPTWRRIFRRFLRGSTSRRSTQSIRITSRRPSPAAVSDRSRSEAPCASVPRPEARLYLESQLLRVFAVMAMAHVLDVRVPFVDHVLLGALWHELGRQTTLPRRKRLLRSTLDPSLP